MTEIVVADGGTVVAEQLIAKIDSTAVAAAAPATAAPAPAAAPAAAPAKAAAPAAKAGAAAAPSAAKILAEKNIDAGQVAGSGRDGRITKGDALNASAGGAKSAALPSAPVPMGDRPEERVPMSRLRARIAERLLESQANNAILTTFNEVNMILRDVDQMNLADIEKKIAEFGAKARDGKLSIEELTGGTFSISNGGVFGSMLSTPIINPPQSAILGIHATKDRAVVENGQVVVRPINYLALSYDHRIIDGREAVLGLVAMKDALEDPSRLLLDL